MSTKKRSHRRGGHPAKLARRRDRNAARSQAAARGPNRLARPIVRDALGLSGPLDAELWGSALMGMLWSRRYALRLENLGSSDYARMFGGPLVEAIGRIGGTGARIALSVIEAVDDGELGLRAGELAGEVPEDAGHAVPDWIAALGEAEITDAAVMRDEVFDDACTVFLEARHPDGNVHAVGVLVDHNLGGMAKDVMVVDSIDGVARVMREHPEPNGALKLERISPGIAAGRIHAALELTDMTWDPPVSEDYADLRALALMRADETPRLVVANDRAEMPSAERDRLRDEFLRSPEGQAFAPDSDEAYAVSLAIDFCADYVDGRPLRWSPVVVELFMADWIPRKILNDSELFARLPSALDAWVRFAGRKSNLPEWAVAATREAIPAWHETMVERSEDPAAAGPAKEFLTAVQKAGIDLEDRDALDTFVAGWNARSVMG